MKPAPAGINHQIYEQHGCEVLWTASSRTRTLRLPLLSVTSAALGINLPHMQAPVQLHLAPVAFWAHRCRFRPPAGLRPRLENL